MSSKKQAQVFHFDLYGKREEKYEFLNQQSIDSIPWTELEVEEPYFFFVKKDFASALEFEAGFKIDELFTLNNVGIATGKDSDLVSYGKTALEEKYLQKAIKYSYRPFDNRFTIFDKKILQRARYDIMKHLVNPNVALQITSKNRQLSLGYFFISKNISDRHLLDTAADSMSVFPLYLYQESERQHSIDKPNDRQPNLNTKIVQTIKESLNLTFTNEKESTPSTFAPIDILDYIYAVLHSPTYREKYKEFLKIDFPRVPYPKDADTFWQLVKLGGELRQVHLLESPAVSRFITKYPVEGNNLVTKPRFEPTHPEPQNPLPSTHQLVSSSAHQLGSVWINETQYFAGVPKVAWEFYIGGYQPAQKWLKDRKGRVLNFEDILHYQKIIVALSETARIMGEIDGISIE